MTVPANGGEKEVHELLSVGRSSSRQEEAGSWCLVGIPVPA
jgi:hypothetical protein